MHLLRVLEYLPVHTLDLRTVYICVDKFSHELIFCLCMRGVLHYCELLSESVLSLVMS